MIQDPEYLALKTFCIEAVGQTGAVIRSYFRSNYSLEVKGDNTPVTIADKKAEEILRKLIEKEFPGHGTLGEEYGHSNPDSEYTWVLDPIDGTKSFISGSFDFGTMIGLLHKGVPIFGAIHQPILNDLFLGDSKHAERNGEKISCRSLDTISDATLLTTSIMNFDKYQDYSPFEKLAKQTKICRTWGNCFGYTLVASGLADIMIDPITNVWDIVALIPIIEGAGGVITDYFGKPAITGASCIACGSKALHERVLKELAG